MEKYNDKKYQFGRVVSALVFNPAFRPRTYALNKVPKEGPIIFCGNHLHVWDQYPVLCATHHTIHWMAKKEYFDGKMGPIFSFMGCICVDRQHNPHASLEEAVNYLKLGSNIGLFPEGTRNALKGQGVDDVYQLLTEYHEDIRPLEEFKKDVQFYHPRMSQVNKVISLLKEGVIDETLLYPNIIMPDSYLKDLASKGIITREEYEASLLLPFKLGAVTMAKETDATIVPFAVTGDYKITNDNLMVNFGDPFKVGDDTLTEANQKLEQKVRTLLLENYRR